MKLNDILSGKTDKTKQNKLTKQKNQNEIIKK